MAEFCHEWGMVCLIVGGIAAFASLPEDVAEPIGYLLLGAAVLIGLGESFRPKPKRRRR